MEKKQKNQRTEEKTSKKPAETQAQLEEYTNLLKRLQAEFENYMKRVEKERQEFVNNASEKILCKLLPVIDDIERAQKQEKLPEGVEMIFKNFLKLMQEEKIEKIKCEGKKFDPFTQEVLLQEESDLPEETVLEVLQEGYTHNGKTIRPAKVKITKPKEDQKQDQNQNQKTEQVGEEK